MFKGTAAVVCTSSDSYDNPNTKFNRRAFTTVGPNGEYSITLPEPGQCAVVALNPIYPVDSQTLLNSAKRWWSATNLSPLMGTSTTIDSKGFPKDIPTFKWIADSRDSSGYVLTGDVRADCSLSVDPETNQLKPTDACTRAETKPADAKLASNNTDISFCSDGSGITSGSYFFVSRFFSNDPAKITGKQIDSGFNKFLPALYNCGKLTITQDFAKILYQDSPYKMGLAFRDPGDGTVNAPQTMPTFSVNTMAETAYCSWSLKWGDKKVGGLYDLSLNSIVPECNFNLPDFKYSINYVGWSGSTFTVGTKSQTISSDDYGAIDVLPGNFDLSDKLAFKITNNTTTFSMDIVFNSVDKILEKKNCVYNGRQDPNCNDVVGDWLGNAIVIDNVGYGINLPAGSGGGFNLNYPPKVWDGNTFIIGTKSYDIKFYDDTGSIKFSQADFDQNKLIFMISKNNKTIFSVEITLDAAKTLQKSNCVYDGRQDPICDGTNNDWLGSAMVMNNDSINLPAPPPPPK